MSTTTLFPQIVDAKGCFQPMSDSTRRYLAEIDRHTQAIGAGTVDGLHQALTAAAKIAKEAGKTQDADGLTRAASELCDAWEALATWNADLSADRESEDMAEVLGQSGPGWYAEEDRIAA